MPIPAASWRRATSWPGRWRRPIAAGGAWLDARSIADFPARFPGITAMLARHGLDAARDLLPVAPALHYAMGGIQTDLEGRASLPGLWAVGEVASTGVHGANRLASNSLLEGLVFADRAGRSVTAAGPDRDSGPRGRVGAGRRARRTLAPTRPAARSGARCASS